jgi:hypothetical protein
VTTDRIGFDRFIRLRWLDETALLAAEHRDGDLLRKALLQRLAHDLAGKEAQQKTVIQLTRIWWRVPEVHCALRDEALARFDACSLGDRLILHWGMTLLAFPLFAQAAAYVGRLLRLQGTFCQSQLRQRLGAEWGPSTTLRTAVPRIVRSMLEWGVLQVDGGEVGVYRSSVQPVTIEPAVVPWAIEALLTSRTGDAPLADLLRSAELFPFVITVASQDLVESNRLHIYQQGQDMIMVHVPVRVP